MEILAIAGNIGRDPELRHTQGGDDVLSFSVAVDQGKDRDGNKRDAKWFDCSLWGKRAGALQPYLRKGMKVSVTGRVSAREHNGKAYLQVSVDQITMQGEGQRRDAESNQGSAPAGGYGGGMPDNRLEDEIPFAPIGWV